MYYVYVLKSERTGRKYIGSTANLQVRLEKHNSGATTSTRSGRPWSIVHVEEFSDKPSALARERFYKTGKGREHLKALGL